jgi:hypothetical protein
MQVLVSFSWIILLFGYTDIKATDMPREVRFIGSLSLKKNY